MQKMWLCLFVIGNLLTSVEMVHAAGDSGKSKMSRLYQRSGDGMIAVYKDSGSWNNPDGCQKSDAVVVVGNNPYRKDFYSSLLAAKIANGDTQFYLVDCFDWNGVTYPAVWGVYTF